MHRLVKVIAYTSTHRPSRDASYVGGPYSSIICEWDGVLCHGACRNSALYPLLLTRGASSPRIMSHVPCSLSTVSYKEELDYNHSLPAVIAPTMTSVILELFGPTAFTEDALQLSTEVDSSQVSRNTSLFSARRRQVSVVF